MNNFKNQKIGILGLGEENLALLEYLAEHGANNITICDQKSRGELGEGYRNFEKSITKWNLGKGYLDNLQNFDIIFRAPGLPYFSKKIQAAKKEGVGISSQTKLFFENCQSPIIGITGTKGKGTTTALIGEILKKSGKDVYLGGNIGTPPISFLDKLTKDNIVVLELSSFQLQDLDRSPHIAVVLDIKVDHLDYHQNEKEYIQAKRNIVQYQTKEDFAVINADYLTSFEFASSTLGQVFWFSRRKSVDLGTYVRNDEIILRTENNEYPIIKTTQIKLRGEHNLENITAAITASYIAGANIKSIKKTIKEFKGLKHRLELVAEIDNVKFYNDSFSTTPDTTIAAIRSFTEPIILLIGGSEKNADYNRLIEVINNSNIKLIIPIGETAKRIIPGIGEIKSMAEAIQIAANKAKPGDVVLLSPASASFDRFKNYQERGERFKREILC